MQAAALWGAGAVRAGLGRLGTLQSVIAALAAGAVAALGDGTALPMAAVMAACSACGLIVLKCLDCDARGGAAG